MRSIDGLQLRRIMGRKRWAAPVPFGPNGWSMDSTEKVTIGGEVAVDVHGQMVPVARVIVSTAYDDQAGAEVHHASISRRGRVPGYEDLVDLHRAVWGTTGWAYQAFAPAADHINIHAHALHLWGLASGEPMMPNFGRFGSI